MNKIKKVKVFAFYLPQFHPIRQNDEWWGKGFTEWRNVVLSKPRFKHHHQPQIPADLGFYDLRLLKTHIEQAKLARAYGIEGFCYYHYWFNDVVLLNEPLDVVLENPEIDLPYMMCWANENWTRKWDGKDSEVLIEQDYKKYDPAKHINYLSKFFADDRYIKILGKPILVIYRSNLIEDLEGTVKSWINAMENLGYPGLYLISISTSIKDDKNALRCGFTKIIDFQPSKNHPQRSAGIEFVKYTVQEMIAGRLKIKITKLYPKIEFAKIFNYNKLVEHKVSENMASYVIPCVIPTWDNSARRKTDSTVIQNHDYFAYGRWLKSSLLRAMGSSKDEKFVFINAWNEWAEGCHLEPDTVNGTNFLEETKKIIDSLDK